MSCTMLVGMLSNKDNLDIVHANRSSLDMPYVIVHLQSALVHSNPRNCKDTYPSQLSQRLS